MALTPQQQSTLDSLLNAATSGAQLDSDIRANLPNTVHPPEPDIHNNYNGTDNVINYYKSVTILTPAQQSILNELYKKYGF